jgi:hypothetical protein
MITNEEYPLDTKIKCVLFPATTSNMYFFSIVVEHKQVITNQIDPTLIDKATPNTVNLILVCSLLQQLTAAINDLSPLALHITVSTKQDTNIFKKYHTNHIHQHNV